MTLTRLYSLTCAALITAPMALAHEFWIEPAKFQVKSDMAIIADLRNGQLFEGTRQSFMDNRNTRFEVSIGDETTTITGRMGDRPAIQMPAPGRDGLMILVHEAAPSEISYSDWPKFMKFVEHKNFAQAEATHTARGWAKENFKEVYTRHSKSLVAVGNGEGADEDYRKHRLSLGVTEGAAELGSDKTLWLECNAAELNGVSFTKGCYVGQENTARMNYRQKVNRRLVVVPIAQADEKRQRIAYPADGLSVEHRRVDDLQGLDLPDWLAAAIEGLDAP